jgi:hypothetical protein
VTAEEAQTLADSIEAVAKANAMYYASDLASRSHPGAVNPDLLRMLDEMRAKSKRILVELLMRIKV